MSNREKIGEDTWDEILRQQMRPVMEQVPTMQVASVMVALVLAYVVHDVVPLVK